MRSGVRVGYEARSSWIRAGVRQRTTERFATIPFEAVDPDNRGSPPPPRRRSGTVAAPPPPLSDSRRSTATRAGRRPSFSTTSSRSETGARADRVSALRQPPPIAPREVDERSRRVGRGASRGLVARAGSIRGSGAGALGATDRGALRRPGRGPRARSRRPGAARHRRVRRHRVCRAVRFRRMEGELDDPAESDARDHAGRVRLEGAAARPSRDRPAGLRALAWMRRALVEFETGETAASLEEARASRAWASSVVERRPTPLVVREAGGGLRPRLRLVELADVDADRSRSPVFDLGGLRSAKTPLESRRAAEGHAGAV